ncbi:MAG: hypothetical protein U5L96_17100 [Owenweeksia sp.]|nr:hypothetical protein [Owenweeksia sp.]
MEKPRRRHPEPQQTLLMIHARQQDPEKVAALMAMPANAAKVKSGLKLLTELGAREYATKRRDDYYQKALKNLHQVDGNAEVKEELANFAKWLIQREK